MYRTAARWIGHVTAIRRGNPGTGTTLTLVNPMVLGRAEEESDPGRGSWNIVISGSP